MQFNFVKLPELDFELESVTTDDGRRYTTPDGKVYPSITTVLSSYNKQAILEWRQRVGEEEANKISTQAARRGTSIHKIAERYILNEEDIYRNEMPVNIESFKSIKEILDNHVDNILGIELPLYNRTLKCAGRTDLVAEFDGTLSIIDFKTSRKLKKAEWIESYFLQSTCYAMMFEWIYKIAVPQIVIIITVDNEKTPQVFKLERSQFVNRVLEIFLN